MIYVTTLLTLLALVLGTEMASVFGIANPPKHRHFHHLRRANVSNCAIFSGTWVRDDSYPIYQSSDCPGVVDPEFNCQKFGRPDTDYLRYRWQPHNCDLPRFSGRGFLRKQRGKTVMFVGDSLGKNQWESLICMIAASSPLTKPHLIRRDPLSVCKFLEYGVTLSFYRAPYLVDIDSVKGERVLRLDKISSNSAEWRTADILVFNTGHWWTHTGSSRGWDVMESQGRYYQDMNRLEAMARGLRTWANWVDSNVDGARTRVFFQSNSPTHYNPRDWSSRELAGTPSHSTAKNCYGETAPSNGARFSGGSNPDEIKAIFSVVRQMRFPISVLDITSLSELRKDGHPSIYSGILSPGQRANPARSADCSHWCLPGLPDTWNHLLFSLLLR